MKSGQKTISLLCNATERMSTGYSVSATESSVVYSSNTTPFNRYVVYCSPQPACSRALNVYHLHQHTVKYTNRATDEDVALNIWRYIRGRCKLGENVEGLILISCISVMAEFIDVWLRVYACMRGMQF